MEIPVVCVAEAGPAGSIAFICIAAFSAWIFQIIARSRLKAELVSLSQLKVEGFTKAAGELLRWVGTLSGGADSLIFGHVQLVERASETRGGASAGELVEATIERERGMWWHRWPNAVMALVLILGLGVTMFKMRSVLGSGDVNNLIIAAKKLSTEPVPGDIKEYVTTVSDSIGAIYKGFAGSLLISFSGVMATVVLVGMDFLLVRPMQAQFGALLQEVTLSILLPKFRPSEDKLAGSLERAGETLEKVVKEVGAAMNGMLERLEVAETATTEGAELLVMEMREAGASSMFLKGAFEQLSSAHEAFSKTFGDSGPFKVFLSQMEAQSAKLVDSCSMLTRTVTVVGEGLTEPLQKMAGMELGLTGVRTSVETVGGLVQGLGEAIGKQAELLREASEREKQELSGVVREGVTGACAAMSLGFQSLADQLRRLSVLTDIQTQAQEVSKQMLTVMGRSELSTVATLELTKRSVQYSESTAAAVGPLKEGLESVARAIGSAVGASEQGVVRAIGTLSGEVTAGRAELVRALVDLNKAVHESVSQSSEATTKAVGPLKDGLEAVVRAIGSAAGASDQGVARAVGTLGSEITAGRGELLRALAAVGEGVREGVALVGKNNALAEELRAAVAAMPATWGAGEEQKQRWLAAIYQQVELLQKQLGKPSSGPGEGQAHGVGMPAGADALRPASMSARVSSVAAQEG